MITRDDNAQYVELGITSTALGYIHRLRFLGEGKNQLPRSWLRNLHPRRLPKAVDKLDTRKYNELLVRVFEGFITEMEQQIFNTVYLTGDFEFYTGAMNYRKVLLDSNLPVTRPTLLDKSLRRHRLKNMYHPLIKKDTWHEPTCQDPRFWIYREKVVPNSFESDPEHNLFLLAAINEGGKSRYSTAVGSFIDLGQSGLWVPAEEAEISLVDNIFTHFVHGDNVDQGSRWIEEIERMNTLLFRTTPNSLSIIDDFGSGTNYLETRKPALNAVYGHYRLGATLIMNTHLHELAKDAESGLFPGISVLQIEIKKEGEVWKPTYRVIPGRAGTSHAAEIAEQHGLSKEAIDDMIDTRIAESGLPAELIHPAKLIEIPR